MKLLSIILIFLFSLTGMELVSGSGKIEINPVWLSDYDSAISLSEESGKPVLVIFSGSDWCRPCMILRQSVLESPDFRDFAEKELILLEVDFPRSKKNRLSPAMIQHNEALAERFNPEGVFPYVLLLNSEEEIIGRSEEIPFGKDEFIDMLESWMSAR